MSGPALHLPDYLEKLQGVTFRKLYQQPSTAFAIFRRMLPHLAKTFVMAMLYMPKPMPLSDLEVWVKPEAKRYGKTQHASEETMLPLPLPISWAS
jgi:transcription initiation factor TFIIH subunit 4